MINYTENFLGISKNMQVWDAEYNGWSIRITANAASFGVMILNFQRDDGRIVREFATLDEAKAFVEETMAKVSDDLSTSDAYVPYDEMSSYSVEGHGQIIAREQGSTSTPMPKTAAITIGGETIFRMVEDAAPMTETPADDIDRAALAERIRTNAVLDKADCDWLAEHMDSREHVMADGRTLQASRWSKYGKSRIYVNVDRNAWLMIDLGTGQRVWEMRKGTYGTDSAEALRLIWGL